MDGNRKIAGARRHFSELDTDVLREMWSAEGRMDWAEAALREELLGRGVSSDELNDIAARRAQIAERRALSGAHAPMPEHRWEERPKATAAYAQTIRIARWLTFVPAAWQSAYVHVWILHVFDVDRTNAITSLGDGDLMAFGLAGFFTPIVAIALGTWVCPAKRKAVPVYTLSGLCIIGGILSLYVSSRAGVHDVVRDLAGLDAIVTMAVSVMVAGVYWLAPWRKTPSSGVSPVAAVGE